jgi:hypothetical protein
VDDDELGVFCGDDAAAGENEVAPPVPELRDLSESLAAIPLDWEDWELDDDLRMAARLTRNHPLPPSPFIPPAAPSAAPIIVVRNSQPPTPSVARAPGQGFSWIALSVSLMAFACGAVLVGWSLLTGRADLWRLGLPLALLGQAGWLMGTLLQLESLGRSQRETHQALAEAKEQIESLRQTTMLLSAAIPGGEAILSAARLTQAAPRRAA